MSHLQLQIDNNGYVVVYTDGCCFDNGGDNASAGIGVWFGDNHPLNVSQPLIGLATNNRAEIHAVIAACNRALGAGIRKLKINTDSQNTIKLATQWIHTWLQNGWLNGNGQPVKNKEDIEEMMNLLSLLYVEWNYVEAHSGNYGNDQADQLARQGAQNYCHENYYKMF